MAQLWTLLPALLLVLTVAERLDSQEENENEVLKHTEGELSKSQASNRGTSLFFHVWYVLFFFFVDVMAPIKLLVSSVLD